VAILAQNRKNKPLNSKVKRLQSMLEIRRRIVDGEGYDTIQQQLGLSKRTFYRYLQHVFREDRKVLTDINRQEVVTQGCILIDRLNDIYRTLREIATDKAAKPHERMAALAGMAELSRSIVRTYIEAPTLVAVQKRKLADAEHGEELSFIERYRRENNGQLPPVSSFPLLTEEAPSLTSSSSTTDPNEEE
jgi:AraC-like DNA-binding protein